MSTDIHFSTRPHPLVEGLPLQTDESLGGETTAGLPSLSGSARAGADTRGIGTAARGTISGTETLSTNKLLSLAVTDVLGTGGIEWGATMGRGSQCNVSRGSGGCGGGGGGQ